MSTTKHRHTLRLPQAGPYELPGGLVIVTRYLGWTQCREPRIVAELRRDLSTTYRHTVKCGDGLAELEQHHRAALGCLALLEADAPMGHSFTFKAVGSAADGYHWLTEMHDPEEGPA